MKRDWVPLFSAISTASRLADLSSDTSRLFYTWLLPHCDAWGRLQGDPRVLNAKVWPLAGHTPKETQKALEDCVECGLLDIHEADGLCWIQVPDWDAKAGNIGQLVRDRGRSAFPEPALASLKSTPRVTLGQAFSEQSRTEQNRREEPKPRLRASVLSEFPTIDTPEVAVALTGYAAGRKERRQKAQTDRGLRMGLKKLEPFGVQGTLQAIADATEGGWLGFHEPKAKMNGHAQPREVPPLPDAHEVHRRDRALFEAELRGEVAV